MGLNTQNTDAISFKKLSGKAHTQQNFAVNEEAVSSNIQISYTTIFGDKIEQLPVTNSGLTSLYSNNGKVERVKFVLDIVADTQIALGRSQAYRLKLPSNYTSSGFLGAVFSSSTYLHTTLGKLQIVPSLYGKLKGDGTTEYDPILYQTNGSTQITKFDGINWYLDEYNGILFVQDPPSGYDISSARPGFLEAFLFVGKYLDKKLDTLVVTGATTGSSNITASNGLTKVGNQIKFGGSLTGTTNLTGLSGSTNLNLGTSSNKLASVKSFVKNFLQLNASTNDVEMSNLQLSGISTSLYYLNTAINNRVDINSGGVILSSQVSGNKVGLNISPSNNNILISGASISFKGLQYKADYSANYGVRSLVDVGYLTGVTSNILARNGLTRQGNIIRFGGALTGNTYISGSGSSLNFGTANSKLNSIAFGATNALTVTANSTTVKFDTAEVRVVPNSSNNVIMGRNITHTSQGLLGNNYVFGIDHFVSGVTGSGARWITIFGENHKINAYASGSIINNSSILGGYNNLIVATGGNDVFNAYIGAGQGNIIAATASTIGGGTVLGNRNLLTGDLGAVLGYYGEARGVLSFVKGSITTYVGGGNHTGNVPRVLASGRHSINMSANSTGQTFGHGALADYSMIFGGFNGNVPTGSTNSVIISGDGIKVSNGVINTVNMPKVRIGLGNNASIVTNNSNNNVLVRNGTTGEIELRDVSTLGVTGNSGTTNTFGGRIIYNSYTATTDTDYVGISGLSLTITLPTSPKLFQRMIFADIAGNAFTYNKTINGAGKLINGSSTAQISSSYGSVMLIFNGSNWSGLGFTS